jgi:hypothetical protein
MKSSLTSKISKTANFIIPLDLLTREELLTVRKFTWGRRGRQYLLRNCFLLTRAADRYSYGP